MNGKILIEDIERLPEAAAQFLKEALPGKVYAFYGAMGAGKTTFISEVCRQLGSDEEANSPTFSIVNEYDTQRWGMVFHLDCYRLENEEEGFDAGLEDCFASGHTCFVEWPEKIGGLVPNDAVIVEITALPDGARQVEWK